MSNALAPFFRQLPVNPFTMGYTRVYSYNIMHVVSRKHFFHFFLEILKRKWRRIEIAFNTAQKKHENIMSHGKIWITIAIVWCLLLWKTPKNTHLYIVLLLTFKVMKCLHNYFRISIVNGSEYINISQRNITYKFH